MSDGHLRLLPWVVVLALVSCKGCSGDTSTEARTGPAPRSIDSGTGELQMLDTTVFRLAGETDFENRYSSTVMVTTGALGESQACSGVLLSPRLALTAAHCVCVDGASCVKAAYVTTVTYDSAKARVGTGGRTHVYEGTARPHPEFQLLLDLQGQISSAKADLALVVLEEAVEQEVLKESLASEAVHLGEALTMAGYGKGSSGGTLYGLRFSRRNRAVRVATPADERVLYAQQGAYLYDGFDGGPCFREEGQGRRLVGIASLGTGRELAFTETHPYQEWLRAAIKEEAAR